MSKAKITKLTSTQVSKLAEYHDKWLQIGLSTEPADRPQAERAVDMAYAAAGLPPPQHKVWCDSPYAGALLHHYLYTDDTSKTTRESLLSGACFGQHDASWLGFYEFFRDECHLTNLDPIDGLIQLAKVCGWWWPTRIYAILTERPTALHRDAEGRLHHETGPALRYPDGWSIYAVHGVRVPARVIEAPETLTSQEILAEGNAEVRRVMLDRFGVQRFLLGTKAKATKKDSYGTLYQIELPGDEPLVLVRVVNSSPERDGTFKHYFLRVPPDTSTARAAVAWTFNLPPDQYGPQIES